MAYTLYQREAIPYRYTHGSILALLLASQRPVDPSSLLHMQYMLCQRPQQPFAFTECLFLLYLERKLDSQCEKLAVQPQGTEQLKQLRDVCTQIDFAQHIQRAVHDSSDGQNVLSASEEVPSPGLSADIFSRANAALSVATQCKEIAFVP